MNKSVDPLFRLEQNRGCLSELDSALRLPYYSHTVSAVERLLEVLDKIFALYHSSRSRMGTKKDPPRGEPLKYESPRSPLQRRGLYFDEITCFKRM
jgi:hypothetical protein